MGMEAPCKARSGRNVSEGKALLETDELIFRGAFRVAIPLSSVRSVIVSGGDLTIRSPEATVVLTLGAAAARWADKILHPKSRLDKLGVKPGSVVRVIGTLDASFDDELASRGVVFSKGRSQTECDLIFFAAQGRPQLARLTGLVPSMKNNGALWIIRPKGVAAITESDVMTAGRMAGLVDVKVVSFSATHTAEKFVIPVSRRGPKVSTM